MEKLGEFICSLRDLTHKLILVGDLNVCALKPEFQKIQSFCNIMTMRQIIDSPTNNNRLIDHIYVAHALTVQSHGIAFPIETLYSITWGNIEFLVERNEHH
jgi:endonuclease/exonuclease/phosphatase family metal-dependent hydrolase